MVLRFIPEFTKSLENVDYPLLGPNFKGLYMFGLLHNNNKFIRFFFTVIHISSLFFVISQFIELYLTRNDYKKALLNFSVTALSFVSIIKTISCLILQSRLKTLIKAISQEEISMLKNKEGFVMRSMKGYTYYTRVTTNLYWSVILITTIATVVSPFGKYAMTSSYREAVKNGTEPYPQILSSWFPFDNTKMPGCIWASIVHIIMTIQGAGVVAVYDANAVAIMTFLKGHFVILRERCKRIFGEEKTILSDMNVRDSIKECHRHHTFLLTQYRRFNSLISPVMFIYVLVCSISICCSVVQLSLLVDTAQSYVVQFFYGQTNDVPTTQKFWLMEYVSTLAIQLFLYCWHSNEIAVESYRADRGVFESNWWKADFRGRKQLILLSGKLARPLIMDAGPFTKLSVPTFIDIMKGSYSFYTLFTQVLGK